MKYTVELIETTVHVVEVECSSFDNPEGIACRLWREGLVVDPCPGLISLIPTVIGKESNADNPHPDDTGKDGWRLESPYV